MRFIDTHTHLYLEQFRSDRKEVVERALVANITHMLLPNIDSASIDLMLQMQNDFPGNCLPMIGLHPSSVKQNFEKELEIMEKWLHKEHFIAIGETGMDLYWDKNFKSQQEEALVTQIKWAKAKKIPIVIHARDSFRELFSILDKYADQDLLGVFHSFSGNREDALHILEYGFYLGINGIITFKNAGLDKILEKIPPENILLETDSPYLAPVPLRGKRNESSYIIHIAEKLAGVLRVSLETIADITTNNAKKLFNLKY